MSSSSHEDRRRHPIGAVLAGGRSGRMGAPKAGVELGGRPLVAYSVETLVAAGLEPVVVAKPQSEIPHVDCPIVLDADPLPHPAAGILAALRAGEGRPAVVVACDMPFVPPALIAALAALDAHAAVPRVRGRMHPLLARYGPSVIPALEAAIEREAPLHEAVAALDPLVLGAGELARFGEPERITFNVNDRDDLAAAERLVAVAPSR
ncbi:MAG TPA: molybdenum cofactor guanylyltransferase [Solirubrobacterales bacterium]|nr:molybdenum cofactor guanylyltransferase [Solirubrobacterales bacterium]